MFNGADLEWMEKAFRGCFLFVGVVCVVGGILLWELGKWLFSHVHVWWK
jgi:hypothetical protein